MDVPAFRRELLGWYRAEARDLPWRRSQKMSSNDDAYAVVVSEFMLQQTRVATVVGRYKTWIQRFPDWQALAAAPEADVLAAWSGLGYYRRARLLHRLARWVMDQEEPRLPREAIRLARLPGIGAYTAAAVASIAHKEPVAAVDGNVRRVASRIAAIDGAPGGASFERAVQAWADDVLAGEDPGAWNQAVMELGATVCTPKPQCETCPVERHCESRRDGKAAQRPARRVRRVPPMEVRHYAVVRDNTAFLLVQEPGEGLLGGLWRLPGGPMTTPLEEVVHLETGQKIHMSGVGVPSGPAVVEHRFTHRAWRMHVHEAGLAGPRRVEAGTLRTLWTESLDGLGVSTAMRKAVAAVAPAAGGARRSTIGSAQHSPTTEGAA